MDAQAAVAPPTTTSLLRSGALSLITSAAPLVVALAALPLLTRRLGSERLGLLALAWAWLGYATLLDFGLGRALTRLVSASDVGEALEAPIGALVATAHLLLAGVGMMVGVAGALLAPWYVGDALQVSDAVRNDALWSAIIFALTVPAVTGASVPRAVLEARLRFREVNLIRLPVSVGTFAIPVILLPLTTSLTAIAASLAVLRAWAWWRYASIARRSMPRDDLSVPALGHVPRLLRAGAWMTVSNVLSPLMTVADRFLVGSMVSIAAVALYAVPWEAITKLLIVPGAVTMVIFPAVSRAAVSRGEALVPLHGAGLRLVAVLVLPACAAACLLAPWLLLIAGGAEYRGESVLVLRILAVGVAANGMAAIPYSLLQASGRARWTATLHLMEIVPYLVLLWFAVERWGIVGAAAAWTARVVIDGLLMAWCAQLVAPLRRGQRLLNAVGLVSVGLCAWAGSLPPGTGNGAPLIAAALLAGGVTLLAWTGRSAAERLVLGGVRGHGPVAP